MSSDQQNRTDDGDDNNNNDSQYNPSDVSASQHGNQQHPHREADTFVDQITAALPPGLANRSQKSADEILKEMNRIPLFMTNLDDASDNELVDAIKAIAYEGTRAEVAQNFREQGNDAARAKLWPDAREFYTKAIQAVRGNIATNEGIAEDAQLKPLIEEDPNHEEEAQREREIEEACLCNRALCNLEMKNFGACNRDCAATLSLNPKNIKAWYRAASACLFLDKLPEAQDACDSGLKFDKSNTPLHTLSAKISKRREYLATLERERAERASRTASQNATLRKALRDRGLLTRETDSPPEMEDAKISLADPDDAASKLELPVLLLYPLHAQTDFVKAFAEDETLVQHLEYILPVPWDEKGEYSKLDDVECYMETTSGGLIKAGKKLPLVKLLGSGKMEVVDGLVRVFVVPKDRATEWIEQFKARRGKS